MRKESHFKFVHPKDCNKDIYVGYKHILCWIIYVAWVERFKLLHKNTILGVDCLLISFAKCLMSAAVLSF